MSAISSYTKPDEQNRHHQACCSAEQPLQRPKPEKYVRKSKPSSRLAMIHGGGQALKLCPTE
jgi:hypothetical protein